MCLRNGHIINHKGDFSYYKEFSEILVINRRVHEPLEEFIFQELIASLKSKNLLDPCLLELRSYWAHYSMWFLQAFPSAKAVVVEPCKENIEAGIHNFKINNYRGNFIN